MQRRILIVKTYYHNEFDGMLLTKQGLKTHKNRQYRIKSIFVFGIFHTTQISVDRQRWDNHNNKAGRLHVTPCDYCVNYRKSLCYSPDSEGTMRVFVKTLGKACLDLSCRIWESQIKSSREENHSYEKARRN